MQQKTLVSFNNITLMPVAAAALPPPPPPHTTTITTTYNICLTDFFLE